MMQRRYLSRLLIAVAMSLVALSCSSDNSFAGPIETIDLREPIEESSEVQPGDGSDETEQTPAAEVLGDSIEIIEEPARRVEEDLTIDAANWVARTAMGSTFVELIWSPVEGADSYMLYRLPTAEADYDAIATGIIDGAEEVYEGPDFGIIDDDVPAGEFLTYVLVAEVGDETTEPVWTEALTIDDVEPPAPLTGLTATETADGLLLEWEPSPDNVEFAAYNVTILQDDGQLRFVGGGADVGQVSFLDDEDFSGTRTYVVAAVDFHNNVSEPGQVEVTR